MKKSIAELQQLKGVGEVLSKRLIDAGYDTLGKVAAAGEEGLAKIRGINPRMLRAIVTQAGELAGEAGKERAEKVALLRQRANALKEQVQAIALSVRDRFGAEAAGKLGQKVEKELVKVITSLEMVEGKLEGRQKKAGKRLGKAEKRLSGLADAGLKGVGKGLKRARKSLKRVYA
jgi:hypothetical protein